MRSFLVKPIVINKSVHTLAKLGRGAFGAQLYYLLTGNNYPEGVMQSVFDSKKDSFIGKYEGDTENPVYQMIAKMLNSDPNNRPSIQEVYDFFHNDLL